MMDKIKKDGYMLIRQENAPELGYHEASGLTLIEQDGLVFKDLNGNGRLDPYEDWRLEPEVRAADLASQLSREEIAGLMLYSAHQAISSKPSPFGKMFAGTYNGKVLEESEAEVSDLTDQQKKFLEMDCLRHVLITAVDSAAVAAQWNNHAQAFCEGKGHGIPVNISSDPRHGARADTEFNAGAGSDISKWPEALGLAATFDPGVTETFGRVASCEYRRMGIATALSPQIDMASEPRWFRFDGTFGENSALAADMARAYCDGFQETEGAESGWGSDSVNAMVKHWPGGGSGEGGRDAHYAYGKYAVYPGKNFKEHMIPFTEGAFKLKGKTGRASAVMPYYTISWQQDTVNGENVGNCYSRYIISDLLRGKHGYEGVVCTDWGVTHDNDRMDRFGQTCWGVEHLTESERHRKAIEAGVDQFGGNNDMGPVLEAWDMLAEKYGEEAARERFEISARRLLMNSFRTGLFENPYTDPEQAASVVGCPEFVAQGFEAQKKSVVLLKNAGGLLPLPKGTKVYIPDRRIAESRNWFGQVTPAHTERPADPAMVDRYFTWVESPDEADVALCFVASPKSVGYTAEEGYLPVSLQYRPYTARNARDVSLAGGDPLEESTNRSYRGKTNRTENEADLDMILETAQAMGDKPVIVILNTKNPTVVGEFEAKTTALLTHFGVQNQAIFELLTGIAEPSGLLPFQMPADMDTVETQAEDVSGDMRCHTDSEGHVYDFGYGLNFSGMIRDERTEKYGKRG